MELPCALCGVQRREDRSPITYAKVKIKTLPQGNHDTMPKGKNQELPGSAICPFLVELPALCTRTPASSRATNDHTHSLAEQKGSRALFFFVVSLRSVQRGRCKIEMLNNLGNTLQTATRSFRPEQPWDAPGSSELVWQSVTQPFQAQLHYVTS